jgi:hypothetical protein
MRNSPAPIGWSISLGCVAMLGMLYIVITAILMLGAVFGHAGLAGIVVGVLVVLFVLWAVTSRPRSGDRDGSRR